MKTGDLVKWSVSWIASCDQVKAKVYRNQLGIVLGISETINCFKVTWSDGLTSDVHYDYLEALCKSVI